MTKKQALFFLILILLLTAALAGLTYFLAKKRVQPQPEKIPWANTNATNTAVASPEPVELDTSGWLTYRNDLIEFSYPKSFGDYKDKYLYNDFDRNKIVGREIVFKEQGIQIEYAIPYVRIGRETNISDHIGTIANTEVELLEYCKKNEYYNCQKLTLKGFEFIEFYAPEYNINNSQELIEMLKVLLGKTPNETYPGLYLGISIDLEKIYSLPLSEDQNKEIMNIINELENSSSNEKLEFFEIFKETLTFVQT